MALFNIFNRKKQQETITKESAFDGKKIENIFLEKSNKIYSGFFSCLFNDENKYSDKSIFEKTESFFKNYFENFKINWEDNKDKVVELITKHFSPVLKKSLEQNYNYYISNYDILNIQSGKKVTELIHNIVDKSINDHKNLTPQYARMILAYFKYKFKTSTDSGETLYVNLIRILISNDEMEHFYKTNPDLNEILKKIAKRLEKINVQNIDYELLLQVFKKTRLYSPHFTEKRDINADNPQNTTPKTNTTLKDDVQPALKNKTGEEKQKLQADNQNKHIEAIPISQNIVEDNTNKISSTNVKLTNEIELKKTKKQKNTKSLDSFLIACSSKNNNTNNNVIDFVEDSIDDLNKIYNLSYNIMSLENSSFENFSQEDEDTVYY